MDTTRTTLVSLREADHVLAAADTIADVKQLRDQAATLADWAKRSRLGRDQVNDVTAFKLRCERKAGQLLAAIVTPGGRRLRDASAGTWSGAERSLPDGITEMESYRWQLEAKVSDDAFETWIASTRAAGDEITTAGLLRLAERYKQTSQSQLSLAPGGSDDVVFDLESADAPAEASQRSAPEDFTGPRLTLVLTVAEHRDLQQRCDRLAKSYGTRTPTATICEAVRREADRV